MMVLDGRRCLPCRAPAALMDRCAKKDVIDLRVSGTTEAAGPDRLPQAVRSTHIPPADRADVEACRFLACVHVPRIEPLCGPTPPIPTSIPQSFPVRLGSVVSP